MNKQISSPSNDSSKELRSIDIVNRGLAKRYRAERRFRIFGLAAIIASLVFLALLFVSIFLKGYSAFQQTYIQLDVSFDSEFLTQESLSSADYGGLVKRTLREMFPEVSGRKAKRMLYKLVSTGAAFQIRALALQDPGIIGKKRSIWVW